MIYIKKIIDKDYYKNLNMYDIYDRGNYVTMIVSLIRWPP